MGRRRRKAKTRTLSTSTIIDFLAKGCLVTGFAQLRGVLESQLGLPLPRGSGRCCQALHLNLARCRRIWAHQLVALLAFMLITAFGPFGAGLVWGNDWFAYVSS